MQETMNYNKPKHTAAAPGVRGSHSPQDISSRLKMSAEQIIKSIRANPIDMGDYEPALLSYRAALGELSRTRPGESLWRLEREYLPWDMTNLHIQLPIFPSIVVPFSPGNCWRNHALESILGERFSGHSDSGKLMRTLSLILDRYVECGFPMDKLDDMLRPSVERLHSAAMYGQEGYFQSVIDHALALVENANLLIMSLHKNICTETGELLSEPYPTPKLSSLKVRPSIGKLDTLSGRLGINLDSSSIGKSLARKWGIRVFDAYPSFDSKPARMVPTKSELVTHLNVVMRFEKETKFVHPDLPGSVFTREQCDAAVSLAIEANKSLGEDPAPVPEPTTLSELLRSNPAFRDAKTDFRTQLRVALEFISAEQRLVHIRSKEDGASMPPNQAMALAITDVSMARDMVSEYLAMKEKPPTDISMVLRAVQRMIQLADALPDESEYDIALRVIDERRGKGEIFTTQRPPPDMSVPPAPIVGDAAGEPAPAAGPEIQADAVSPPEGATEGDAAAGLPEAGSVAQISAQRSEAIRRTEPYSPVEKFQPMEFVFPFGDQISDEALNGFLPSGSDERSRYVRMTAHTVLHYINKDVPDADIHPNYLPMVQFLRSNISYQGIADLSSDLVDLIYQGRLKELKRTNLQFPPVPSIEPGSMVPRESEPPVQQQIEAVEPSPEGAEAARQSAAPQPISPVGAEAESRARVSMDEEATSPGFMPASVAYKKLLPLELELIGRILDKNEECSEADLEQFMAMHPGTREFRFQNIVSSVWTTGDWRGDPEKQTGSDFDMYANAKEHIYSTCNLRAPSESEKREAALEPANLADTQRYLIARFFNVHAASLTPQLIDQFGVWLRGDEKELQAYWSNSNPDPLRLARLAQTMATRATFTDDDFHLLCYVLRKTPDQINVVDTRDPQKVIDVINNQRQRQAMWFEPTMEQRLSYWRTGTTDLLTVGDIVHKSSYTGQPLRDEEVRLICSIFNQPLDRLTPALLESMMLTLRDGFTDKYYGSAEFDSKILRGSFDTQADFEMKCNEFDENDWKQLARIFQKPQFKITAEDLTALQDAAIIYKTGASRDMPVNFYTRELMALLPRSNDMDSDALLIAARNESEFQTLAGFLGAEVGKASGRLDFTDCVSRPKFKNGGYSPKNDDAITAATVTLPDGERVILEAVFDGMGGHSSGDVASGIAKKIFEISAVAGWIQSPEDVRRVLILADLSIALSAISGKKNMQLPIVENNMGTTAVVGFQKGSAFFGIHCGDSDYKVFHNNALVLTSVGHAHVNTVLSKGVMLSSNMPEVAKVLSKLTASADFKVESEGGVFTLTSDDLILVRTNGREVCYEIARDGVVICEGRGPPIMQDQLISALQLEGISNIVNSVLGVKNDRIHINNAILDYAPFELGPDYLIVLCSDGISIPICDHEIPKVLEQSGGDPSLAASALLSMAEDRRPKPGKNDFETICDCEPRRSKNDDKSLRLRLASYGMDVEAADSKKKAL